MQTKRDREKVVFHIDMDAFFTSVEQRDNPSLKGKPVIVGASPGQRGVVSAASYEARKYGVRSAMPISEAYKRCPHGVYLRPRHHYYTEISRSFIDILYTFSPEVEQISIDEAFVDMSGCGKLWGKPRHAAQTMAETISSTLNLTASIGVAPNKFLAKVASDMHKPNGITIVPFEPNEIIQWLAPLSISKIWGVGKQTEQQCNRMGIYHIGDLQNISLEKLVHRFGKQGAGLYNLCHGIDRREVHGYEKAKSISREHTFNKDCGDTEQWFTTVLSLAADVAQQARKANQKARTVFLTYRTPDFKRFTRQITVTQPTNVSKHIYEHASNLLKKELNSLSFIRLIGVGITNFDEAVQIDLFENAADSDLWNASERAMDTIIGRFGKKVIFRAREIQDKNRIHKNDWK